MWRGFREERSAGRYQICAVKKRGRRTEHIAAFDQVQSAGSSSGNELHWPLNATAAHNVAPQIVRADDRCRRMILRHRDHTLKAFRKNVVVGENHLYVARQWRGFTHGSVIVRDLINELFVANDTNSRVSLRVLRGDLGRSIGALIVHEDVLEVRIRLLKHAFDAFAEIIRGVVEGSYDAHKRSLAHRDLMSRDRTASWRFTDLRERAAKSRRERVHSSSCSVRLMKWALTSRTE